MVKMAAGKPERNPEPELSLWVEVSEGGKLYLYAQLSTSGHHQLLAIFNTDGTVELRRIFSEPLCQIFRIKPGETLYPELRIEDPKCIDAVREIKVMELRDHPDRFAAIPKSPEAWRRTQEAPSGRSQTVHDIAQTLVNCLPMPEFAITRQQWLHGNSQTVMIETPDGKFRVSIEKVEPPLVAPKRQDDAD